MPYRQVGSFKPGHRGWRRGRALVETATSAPARGPQRRGGIEQRYGRDLSPSMTIQDFPVTYEELEASLDMFERVCGTAGKAGVINGQRVEGGNPFRGLALAQYPLPPNPRLPGRRVLLEGRG